VGTGILQTTEKQSGDNHDDESPGHATTPPERQRNSASVLAWPVLR